MVPSTAIPYAFDPEATYVIAGGLGGLGRCIARWMVANQAKNLILLSRSKVHSEAAATLLQELQEKGVRVATPQCNVSDEESLKRALVNCAWLPPIKGCIQGSMVLKVWNPIHQKPIVN